MNYGLYLSASGVLTNLYRQDVFANNLANVETIGFKPDVASMRQRRPEAIEDRMSSDLSHRLLDHLGGGALAGQQRIDFQPGPLRVTNDAHDVALTDQNSFFVVRHTDPETNQISIRLTRDGRMSRDAAGYLVLPSGHRVLDNHDRPIEINASQPFRIEADAHIVQGDDRIARLQVAQVADPMVLRKQGQNLFAFEGPDPRQIVEDPVVHPGALEASAVDPIHALMRLIAASKAAMGNAQMIRYHDLLMDRAVNQLGRVA